jgi:integrase
MKFTDRAVAALKASSERYEVWEGGGFGVRVTSRGIKSWIWLYRYRGRPRRMTFGSYPAMSLAEARVRVAEARRSLLNGTDPGSVLVVDRKAERDAETVNELVDDYLYRWARPNKRNAAEDERILRKDVIPLWGRRKAKDVSRRDVIAMLDGIVERGAPIQANRTLAVVRRMFNWAISRDVLDTNPCHMVKAPGKETRRDRVLNAEEVAAFWHGLDECQISWAIRLALRVQLVTAQRKGEIVGAEWAEIDLDDGVWTIPPEKSKNRMSHRVPLSRLALEVLNEAKSNAGESGWLFPSPRGDKPVRGSSVDHALRNNRDVLMVGDATPHDLRRTAASHMTGMGVSRLTISKILNHAEPGVTAVYDRHSYDQEKRQALDVWGRRLSGILAGRPAATNIVALPTVQR